MKTKNLLKEKFFINATKEERLTLKLLFIQCGVKDDIIWNDRYPGNRNNPDAIILVYNPKINDYNYYLTEHFNQPYKELTYNKAFKLLTRLAAKRYIKLMKKVVTVLIRRPNSCVCQAFNDVLMSKGETDASKFYEYVEIYYPQFKTFIINIGKSLDSNYAYKDYWKMNNCPETRIELINSYITSLELAYKESKKIEKTITYDVETFKDTTIVQFNGRILEGNDNDIDVEHIKAYIKALEYTHTHLTVNSMFICDLFVRQNTTNYTSDFKYSAINAVNFKYPMFKHFINVVGKHYDKEFTYEYNHGWKLNGTNEEKVLLKKSILRSYITELEDLINFTKYPFNLDRALAGDELITREGIASINFKLINDPKMDVYIYRSKNINQFSNFHYTKSGKILTNVDSVHDLFMKYPSKWQDIVDKQKANDKKHSWFLFPPYCNKKEIKSTILDEPFSVIGSKQELYKIKGLLDVLDANSIDKDIGSDNIKYNRLFYYPTYKQYQYLNWAGHAANNRTDLPFKHVYHDLVSLL